MASQQLPPLARAYTEFQWAPQLYPLHSQGLLQWGMQHYPNENVVSIRKRLAKSLYDQIFRDKVVMRTYGDGLPDNDESRLVALIERQERRWAQYRFGAWVMCVREHACGLFGFRESVGHWGRAVWVDMITSSLFHVQVGRSQHLGSTVLAFLLLQQQLAFAWYFHDVKADQKRRICFSCFDDERGDKTRGLVHKFVEGQIVRSERELRLPEWGSNVHCFEFSGCQRIIPTQKQRWSADFDFALTVAAKRLNGAPGRPVALIVANDALAEAVVALKLRPQSRRSAYETGGRANLKRCKTEGCDSEVQRKRKAYCLECQQLQDCQSKLMRVVRNLVQD